MEGKLLHTAPRGWQAVSRGGTGGNHEGAPWEALMIRASLCHGVEILEQKSKAIAAGYIHRAKHPPHERKY